MTPGWRVPACARTPVRIYRRLLTAFEHRVTDAQAAGSTVTYPPRVKTGWDPEPPAPVDGHK